MIIGMTPEDERILAKRAKEVGAKEDAAIARLEERGPQLKAASAAIQQNGSSKASCDNLGALMSGSASDFAVLAEATAWARRAHQISQEQQAVRVDAIEGMKAGVGDITKPAEAECKRNGFAVPVTPKAPVI